MNGNTFYIFIMSTAQVTIDREEYTSLIETNKYYEELLDTFDAIKIAEEEKKSGRLKELGSLSEIM